MAGYDIIGDVHGRVKHLQALLRTLGYKDKNGAWRHPDRQAIFVGDLIDRGPEQIETVELVRSMVDANTAQCILGNHEFNAIAWATPDPERPGEFLRSHHWPGNRDQHKAFLAEVEGRSIHGEFIDWFKTLPLWLDLGPLRVVHACWNAEHVDELRPHLHSGGGLTDELIVTSSRDGHWSFRAVEMLCKGPDTTLPDGLSFRDKEGKERRAARVKWWAQYPSSLKDAVIAPLHVLETLADHPVSGALTQAAYAGPPVFFGHYSLRSEPATLSPLAACVDYYSAAESPLVAYRWDGEEELADEKFVTVQPGIS